MSLSSPPSSFDSICKEEGIDLPPVAAHYFNQINDKNTDRLRCHIKHVHQAFQSDSSSGLAQSLTELFKQSLPSQTLPLYSHAVACGFSSPVDDNQNGELSLDEHLIQNPEATFFLRASGDSMTGVGIFDGDLLVVDRSLEPTNGTVVLAVINTEFTVKRLIKKDDAVILRAENPKYPDVHVTSHDHFMVWGVVAHVIHHLK